MNTHAEVANVQNLSTGIVDTYPGLPIIMPYPEGELDSHILQKAVPDGTTPREKFSNTLVGYISQIIRLSFLKNC